MNKTIVHVVYGPTASGKTKLALELANKLNGELINCDSRQLYTDLTVGVNKEQVEFKSVVNQNELSWNEYLLQGTPIHLLNLYSLSNQPTASDYSMYAKAAIQNIASRGKTPILVGGTGLYILAALTTNFGVDSTNKALRAQLSSKTVAQLQEQLILLDAASKETSNNSDWNNPRRLVRKIENLTTGKQAVPLELSKDLQVELHITNLNPELLKQNIALRLDQIFTAWCKEVKYLLSNGSSMELPGMRCIGYKQVADFLQGKANFAGCKKSIISAQWQYAKRQITFTKQLSKLL